MRISTVSVDSTADFVAARDLSRDLGVSDRKLRRDLAARGIAVYADPLDQRRRLLRRADVDLLLTPRPVRHSSAGEGGTA